MRISTEKVRDSNRNTIGVSINLQCKTKSEFIEAYEKVKHLKDIECLGSPIEGHNHYKDSIAYVDKGCYTLAALTSKIDAIAYEIKSILVEC